MRKTRLIVLTDISTLNNEYGEPDDTQSLIRLLLYSNEFDIEGLIATYTKHGERINPQYIKDIIKRYGKVRDNLILYDKNYPTETKLLKAVKCGNHKCGMDEIGEGKDTEGSEHIINIVDKNDNRPVWITIWGGPTDLAQAIWKITNTRSTEDIIKFKSKIRIYSIHDQYDKSGQWIKEKYPDIFYITSYNAFRGMYRGGNEALASENWVKQNIVEQHGLLGEAYPIYNGGDNIGIVRGLKEGDTPSFLYLVHNGLNDTSDPLYGGWGGRFERAGNQFTDAKDTFDNETSERAAVFRWRSDYQADFASRMDWCVKSYNDANHAPVPVIEGKTEIVAQSGDVIQLNAEMSYDPDGDDLTFKWEQYKEAGSCENDIEIIGADKPKAFFTVSDADRGTILHIILSVTDNGIPSLTRYKRIVVNIEK